MRLHLPAVFVVWIFGLASLHAATIVKDGEAAVVLVAPDEAAPNVQSNAILIRETIAKMSGADLAIVPESKARPADLLRPSVSRMGMGHQ